MDQSSAISRFMNKGCAIVLAALLLFTGCGVQDNPLGSVGTVEQDHATSFHPLRLDSPSSGTPLAKSLVTESQLISAANGGEIEIVGNDYTYTLDIPPGALAVDTYITMTVPDDNESVVTFAPHGLQFLLPVELEMEVNLEEPLTDEEEALESLDIYYNNEASGSWEAQGSIIQINIDHDEIEVDLEINHFSQYGLGGYCIIQKACIHGWGNP